jgi:cytochrome bd ubiquinol oxidase subunit I
MSAARCFSASVQLANLISAVETCALSSFALPTARFPNESEIASLLARIQFAFTVSFHIIFPAFTIGLASFLAVLERLWLWKKDDAAYLKLFDYWKTIFAVTFGMGVVSGIVMSYQFGTNWSVFSDKAGP